MKITAEKDDKQQPAKTDLQLQELTESHRYILAMLFVLSFMVIMVLAVLGTIFWGYTGIANLVGFFSGWVAAVIGFYFLQQNTAGAQAQAKNATDSAAVQHARANLESEKKSKLASETSSDINDLARIINEFVASSRALKEKTRKQLVPEDVQKFQTQVESLLKQTKGTGKQLIPEFHTQVESLLKETKGTGKQLIPDDVQEFQTQIESLSREAEERIKKARHTITLYST
jgi:HPt (histidine-containing phosphotransfer) domain-containing protein